MGYFESIDWDGIKKDLQKGMEKGMAAMKKGAIVAQKTAGDLTDEGKRQYKIFSLKTKVHEGVSDLGARVYALMGSRAKNPALDPQVKTLVANIKKLDAQIAELEGKPGAAKPKKKAK
ncbi:MAG: hypothetical protein ACYC7L_06935 [Nitrospirota bacterium]